MMKRPCLRLVTDSIFFFLFSSDSLLFTREFIYHDKCEIYGYVGVIKLMPF